MGTDRGEPPSWLTPEQRDTYEALGARWPRVSCPFRLSRGDGAGVECFYPGALGSAWLCIAPDGSTEPISEAMPGCTTSPVLRPDEARREAVPEDVRAGMRLMATRRTGAGDVASVETHGASRRRGKPSSRPARRLP
jgi:hypothetical protein